MRHAVTRPRLATALMTCNPGMPGCPKSSQAYRLPTAHCSSTPQVASKLPELDKLPGQVNLEPWITLNRGINGSSRAELPRLLEFVLKLWPGRLASAIS